MWIYHIEQLSGRFYVIAIDAIGGSGKSEPNERYANEFDQTAWLDELLDAMKIEAACVAGVSYGAYLAYHYAIWRPARVTKIVCMAGRVASSQFEVMSKMMHWYYLLKHFNNRSMMKHAITIFTDEQLESIREKALFLIGERDILSNNHEQPEEVNWEIISYLLA
ncbi:alpha/beta hydrolase fold protein [Paenibacillus dendritiformis C454]|uniref:Alpha/beta hydrolase fold protein n=2 Tax=Paenibacillus dendritiformis TaxID=130049 RepID=H3SHW0_9BACL|nr:alpha/beta hydrolase [Paenibacillus dendritiformis]EHQ61355.1 alpha/beta hydrolase fold protein [Paenibacillus dendritiformis C454]